ncbi:MAG: hypothetical protein M1837_001364 [Sclerophora amabilis]|nr:MAG: hypothetical protein M1837_001364 [Sclerophora amabilis]
MATESDSDIDPREPCYTYPPRPNAPEGPLTSMIQFEFKESVKVFDTTTDVGRSWDASLQAISRLPKQCDLVWGSHAERSNRVTLFVGWPDGLPHGSIFDNEQTKSSSLLRSSAFSSLLPFLSTDPEIWTVFLIMPITRFSARTRGQWELMTVYFPSDLPVTSSVDVIASISRNFISLEGLLSTATTQIAHDPSGDLEWYHRGWATHTVQGRQQRSWHAHVLLVVWTSPEAEARFKDANQPSYYGGVNCGSKPDDMWERRFVNPLKDLQKYGIQWDSCHFTGFHGWTEEVVAQESRRRCCIVQ